MNRATRRGFLGSLGIAGIGVSAYVSPSRFGTEEDLSAPVPAGRWPMPGRTARRSAHQPETAGTVGDYTRAWQQSRGSHDSTAVGTEDTLFVGGPTALSATDGSVQWEDPLPGHRSSGTLALWKETLYATTEDKLYALDADSGSIQWARPESDIEIEFVAGPTLICTSRERGTVGIDAKTGATRWSVTAHDPVLATEQTVGFQTGQYDTDITGIDPTTGSVEWTAEGIAEQPSHVITLHDGVIYGNTDDFRAFETSSNTVLWEAGFDLEEVAAMSLATDGNRVYCAGRSRVLALDPETGDPQWDRTVEDAVPYFKPAITAEALYVGTGDGFVALEPATGRELIRFSPYAGELEEDRPIGGQLLVAGNQFYYLNFSTVVTYR